MVMVPYLGEATVARARKASGELGGAGWRVVTAIARHRTPRSLAAVLATSATGTTPRDVGGVPGLREQRSHYTTHMSHSQAAASAAGGAILAQGAVSARSALGLRVATHPAMWRVTRSSPSLVSEASSGGGQVPVVARAGGAQVRRPCSVGASGKAVRRARRCVGAQSGKAVRRASVHVRGPSAGAWPRLIALPHERLQTECMKPLDVGHLN